MLNRSGGVWGRILRWSTTNADQDLYVGSPRVCGVWELLAPWGKKPMQQWCISQPDSCGCLAGYVILVSDICVRIVCKVIQPEAQFLKKTYGKLRKTQKIASRKHLDFLLCSNSVSQASHNHVLTLCEQVVPNKCVCVSHQVSFCRRLRVWIYFCAVEAQSSDASWDDKMSLREAHCTSTHLLGGRDSSLTWRGMMELDAIETLSGV